MSFFKFGKTCEVFVHPDVRSHVEIAKGISDQLKTQNKEDAFYLVDLGELVRGLKLWRECLPRVTPFFAVKCNDDPALLRLMADLGMGFDCASKTEICDILALGVHPSRIVYAHTCKHPSFLRYAAKVKVDLMTFDNEEELRKIKREFPNARLLLRILPPQHFKVGHCLGAKFGCHPSRVVPLLRVAKDLELDVVGVSFHVGSGVEESAVYLAAVRMSVGVWDAALALGFTFTLLDVGGGFLSQPSVFRQQAQVLRTALDQYFPEERKVQLIAEPGRFFGTSTTSLTVSVIAKRHSSNDVSMPEKSFDYYLNAGTYGAFACVIRDLGRGPLHHRLFRDNDGDSKTTKYRSTLYGPTCDSRDKIISDVTLPELTVDDVIHFPDMGAYSKTMSMSFNGMPQPLFFYHCSETVWNDTILRMSMDTEQECLT